MNLSFPIYVISLTRASERREAISRRLTAASVVFEMVDAVDGAALNLGEYQHRLTLDLQRQRSDHDLTRGEIGCFLSHYNLWGKIIAEQTPFALILEDDATWDDDFFAAAKAVVASRYYWNIVHLSSPKSGRVISTIDTIGTRELVRYKQAQGTTAAYLIDLDGAKKMYSFCHEIRDSVDEQWLWYWLADVYFYHLHPAVVRQFGDSMMGDRPQGKDKHQLRQELGRFRYFLRANKKRYARRIYHWAHPRKIRQGTTD